MLARVYEIWNDLKLFLEAHGKQDPPLSFTPEWLQLTLTHCVDIFEALNNLNLLMQGRNTKHIKWLWCLSCFHGEAGFVASTSSKKWKRSFNSQSGYYPWEKQIKNWRGGSLWLVKQEFERYFPDVGDTEFQNGRWQGILFVVIRIFSPTICRNNRNDVKFHFKRRLWSNATFNWLLGEICAQIRSVGSVAIRTLLLLSSTHLWEKWLFHPRECEYKTLKQTWLWSRSEMCIIWTFSFRRTTISFPMMKGKCKINCCLLEFARRCDAGFVGIAKGGAFQKV